jgi:hypothetical protein
MVDVPDSTDIARRAIAARFLLLSAWVIGCNKLQHPRKSIDRRGDLLIIHLVETDTFIERNSPLNENRAGIDGRGHAMKGEARLRLTVVDREGSCTEASVFREQRIVIVDDLLKGVEQWASKDASDVVRKRHIRSKLLRQALTKYGRIGVAVRGHQYRKIVAAPKAREVQPLWANPLESKIRVHCRDERGAGVAGWHTTQRATERFGPRSCDSAYLDAMVLPGQPKCRFDQLGSGSEVEIRKDDSSHGASVWAGVSGNAGLAPSPHTIGKRRTSSARYIRISSPEGTQCSTNGQPATLQCIHKCRESQRRSLPARGCRLTCRGSTGYYDREADAPCAFSVWRSILPVEVRGRRSTTSNRSGTMCDWRRSEQNAASSDIVVSSLTTT